MTKHTRIAFTLALLLAVGGGAPGALAQETYAVVSSTGNANRAKVTPKLLRMLYLKELREWPDGTLARPIARPEDSEAHRLFRDQVLRMDEMRLARHWIGLKQRTGQRSLSPVAQDRTLIGLLKRYPGAFAVLPVAVAESDPELEILLKLH
ncbi:MAG: hypothetical protein MJE66_02650 [Proteobacteria bacterium]|nr:hypothetical protein [Pseudomonadota bacterium]